MRQFSTPVAAPHGLMLAFGLALLLTACDTAGPTTVPVEVPGTRAYTWAEPDVRAAVHDYFRKLGVDPAPVLADALVWPPPNHPLAEQYCDAPPITPWTPGGWLVQTNAGSWWVIEAYGSVSPADDRARFSATAVRIETS